MKKKTTTKTRILAKKGKSIRSRRPLSGRSASAAKGAFLWITDPWDTLDHPHDTTLRLMEASLELKVPTYWCEASSIRVHGGAVLADVRLLEKVDPQRTKGDFGFSSVEQRTLETFSAVHYRVDPPVDLHFLQPLQILALHPKIRVVNPLSVLLMQNEKLLSLRLPEFSPATLVSSDLGKLTQWGIQKGKVVLKPLHQAQSKGVELLDFADVQSHDSSQGVSPLQTVSGRIQSLLRQATENFSRPVLLQEYLPEVSEGETRVWFVNGRMLANFKKYPLQGDFRVNMDGGSRVGVGTLSSQEKKAIAAIQKILKEHQIALAAVDLIGGKVTDFNFTSPGLLVQLEQVTGRKLAEEVIVQLLKKS